MFVAEEKPDLFDYDAVGFELDGCLVKYNIVETSKLIIKCHLEELHSMGYPKAVLDFDYTNNLGLCFKNAVWDIQHGTVLKLVECREITHAVRGFAPLEMKEITDLYGDPPMFMALNFPDAVTHLDSEEGAYMCLLGTFDAAKVAVICQVTHLIQKGIIKNKSYLEFAFDLE
jgi:hypothetical protein